MTKLDVLNHIREVYSELEKQHPHKLEEEYGMGADRPDLCFLACLCWIARTDEIQRNLWDKVKINFMEHYNGDIRNIKTENDCKKLGYPEKFVPYRWLPRLSKYLDKEGISFWEFLKMMESRTGIEIRDEFIDILKIGGNKAKRISVFIRDYPNWKKNVFPIDRNVDKMLKHLGLPNDEEIMVHLCEKANVSPRLFERLLYEHGKEVCGHGKTCSINKICLCNKLGLNRC